MSQPTTIKIDNVEYVRKDSIQQAVEVESAEDFKESQIGTKVIVRCKDAGVHFGTLVSYEGREALLLNARRLWYWKCIKGHSLNAVALYGLHKDSKIPAAVEKIALTDACEIISCTAEAAESIESMAAHNE